MNRDLSYDALMEKADSPYTLVIAAARRARNIKDGSKAFVVSESNKPVSIALEEIIEGKVTYLRKNKKSIK
mgnify:CR=1 FL=1